MNLKTDDFESFGFNSLRILFASNSQLPYFPTQYSYAMSLRKLISYLFASLFFIHSLSAQNIDSYRNGYIVLDGSDEKIKGIIQNGDWEETPSKIIFGDQKRTYPISSLSGFGIIADDGSEQHFTKSEIELETSPYLDELLECDNQFNIERKTVFLRILQKGDISLFEHISGKRHHFFIQKKNEKLITLLYKKFRQCIDTNIYHPKNKNTYQNQLSQLFKNCESLSEGHFTTLKYTSSRIIGLINKYNECQSLQTDIQFKKKKARIKINSFVGISHINNRYNDIEPYEPFNTRINSAVTAGLRMEFFSPKSNNTVSFILGMGYRHGNSKDATFSTNLLTLTPDHLRNLEAHLLVRKYIRNKPQFSFALGLSGSYNLVREIQGKYRLGPRTDINYSIGVLDIYGSYSFMYGVIPLYRISAFRHHLELGISYTIFDNKK